MFLHTYGENDTGDLGLDGVSAVVLGGDDLVRAEAQLRPLIMI